MLRLKSPIPPSIVDPKELKEAVKNFKLVPYYGYSAQGSHSFLRLLCDLYTLSPSHGACINDKKFFAFEGDLDIVGKDIPGFIDDPAELSDSDKIDFIEKIAEYGITLIEIIKLTQKLFTNLEATGNCYLYYKEVQTAGVFKVFIKVIHPKHLMYLATEDDEPRTVVIAKQWNEKALKEAKIVRTYPEFTEKKGMRETVFHIKNEVDESDWYGRPSSIQSLHWQMVEFLTSTLNCKISSTEIITKKVLAFEAPEPGIQPEGDEDFAAKKRLQQKAYALRQITTAEGEDPKSLFVVEYPKEGKAPVSIDIEVNRDSAYFKASSEAAADYIYASHRWSKQLIGHTSVKNGIGGNVIKDLLVVKDETVIRPLQRIFQNLWSLVFKTMSEGIGDTSLAEKTVKFPNVIENLVESLGSEIKVEDDPIDPSGS